MRALSRSYGDISILTRSPMVRRMKRLRILPEICASTWCLLVSSTRNIVPASTASIRPSISIGCSIQFFIIFCRLKTNMFPRPKGQPLSRNKKVRDFTQIPHREIPKGSAAVFAAALATIGATISTTAARPRGAFFTRTGFVDHQVAPIDIFAVKGLDGGFRAFLGFHGDKTESARTAAEFIHDQLDARYRAVLGKKVLELIFRGVVREVADVTACAHDDFDFLP